MSARKIKTANFRKVPIGTLIDAIALNEHEKAPVVGQNMHAKLPDPQGGSMNLKFRAGLSAVDEMRTYLRGIPEAVLRRFAAERRVSLGAVAA